MYINKMNFNKKEKKILDFKKYIKSIEFFPYD